MMKWNDENYFFFQFRVRNSSLTTCFYTDRSAVETCHNWWSEHGTLWGAPLFGAVGLELGVFIRVFHLRAGQRAILRAAQRKIFDSDRHFAKSFELTFSEGIWKGIFADGEGVHSDATCSFVAESSFFHVSAEERIAKRQDWADFRSSLVEELQKS